MESGQCPECGANWADGHTCLDHFYTMGMWELDHQLYDVHHLMVLCYYLQHPSLYSPEALDDAKKMLRSFLEKGVAPQKMRMRINRAVDASMRNYKIKGTSDSHAIYPRPVHWRMVAADVTKTGIDHYYDRVYQWAESTLQTLRESGNLSVSEN